ncbi:MAG: family 16 glycosylhydrolase [Clostridia bacterium]|nr:family 16 glycosylhydrolase [Clostridia bacterium]
MTGGILSSLPTVENGSFVYTLIKSENISDELNEEIKELRSLLKDTFDAKVKTVLDTVDEDSADSYEIVLGDTNRSVTETAKTLLAENRKYCSFDFIIKVVDKKIVIYSADETMLCKAVKYFAETYCSSENGWSKLNGNSQEIYEAPVYYYEHKLADNYLKDYIFVTPRDMEYIYGKDVYDFVEHLKDTEGYELGVNDERYDEQKLEILVGDLDRPESNAVKVSGTDWIIKMSGDKLVIKGGDGLALSEALSSFKNMIVDAENKKEEFELSADFELKGTFSADAGDYTLVWSDEFGQDNLDPYWWTDSDQFKYGMTQTNTTHGSSFVWNATNNVKMTGDGCATLFTNKLDNTYYGSYISTFNTMQMRYGIIEIRSKQPIEPAAHSFWLNGALLGNGVMTEYDIVETFGYTTKFASNLHRWWNLNDGSGDSGHTSLDLPEFSDDKRFVFNDIIDKGLDENFHTYTMDWDSERIRFAVDGKVYFEYNLDEYDNPDARMLPVYLIISCRMGQNDYGNLVKDYPDVTYAELKVDYVRLYQKGDNDSLLYTREAGNIPNFNNRELTYENYATRNK